MSTRGQGNHAETLAGHYLRASGYHIVETNWQCGRYELDIIAFDPEERTWVFVEVKSAQSIDTAMRHFTSSKQHYLAYAIEQYLDRDKGDDYEGRLDLLALAIDSSGELKDIDHITNVF